MELFDKYRDRLMFPVDHFRWHAARALIGPENRDPVAAKAHAQRALQSAALDHAEQYDALVQKLTKYCDG